MEDAANGVPDGDEDPKFDIADAELLDDGGIHDGNDAVLEVVDGV